MARKWGVFIVLLSLIALTGCFFNGEEEMVSYKSPEGGFEVKIPANWKPSELDSLLTGVQFAGQAEGFPVKLWILFGSKSGRTPAKQLEDLQAVLAFIVEKGDIISSWEQRDALSLSVAGTTGRKVSIFFALSGEPMKGIGVAFTKEDKDFLLIGICEEAIWEEVKNTFNKIVQSLIVPPST